MSKQQELPSKTLSQAFNRARRLPAAQQEWLARRILRDIKEARAAQQLEREETTREERPTPAAARPARRRPNLSLQINAVLKTIPPASREKTAQHPENPSLSYREVQARGWSNMAQIS